MPLDLLGVLARLSGDGLRCHLKLRGVLARLSGDRCDVRLMLGDLQLHRRG